MKSGGESGGPLGGGFIEHHDLCFFMVNAHTASQMLFLTNYLEGDVVPSNPFLTCPLYSARCESDWTCSVRYAS